MAVFTVSLQQASGVGDVNLGDGTTLATLSVSAGRGPKGDGFTGGTYDAGTGKVTFTSNDGIGFETGDLRGDLTEPGPIGSVTPNTGAFTSLSTTGNAVIGGDLTVEGTTTTVDSTTVAVGDKNIELAKDATTPAEADGGGITLTGASATITYSSANDYWALNKGLNVSGNVSLSGTVDGRDVAADGSKLDGIEAGADVTDTANVTAAGALMDSELTSEASVKALDQGVATTDSPDFAGLTVDTDTLYVDSTNNRVGIGTSSPDNKLEVNGSRNGDLFAEVSNTNAGASAAAGLRLSSDGNNFQLRNYGDATSKANQTEFYSPAGGSHFVFSPNNSEAMRIDSSGNVGIGTSSPAERVTIVSGDTYQLSIKNNSASSIGAFGYDSTDNLRFYGNGAERMRIDSNGNVGIGTSSPGRKLNIEGIAGDNVPVRVQGGAGETSAFIDIKDPTTTGNFKVRIGCTGDSFVAYAGGSEAMRIDSSGRVGIGTSSPDEALTIQEGAVKTGIALGATADHHVFANSGGTRFAGIGLLTSTADLYIEDDAGDSITFDRSANTLKFETNNSEAMRIDSSGNLLVGTTSTTASAQGAQLRDNGKGLFVVDGDEPLFLNRLTSDGTVIDIRQDTVAVGSVSVSGSTTSYNTSSDERLKENITDAQSASDLIDSIQVREFDWKADGEHQRYGMVAQELETVAPEAVTKGESEDDMWAVDYSKLVPMLVKEIQDLRKRVAELENTQ